MPSDARSKAMLPEHVLIVRKDVWTALPEVRSTTDTGE